MIINVPSSRASGFIKSTSEPVGTFIDGTIWYNPNTEEFKTYVAGEGFKAGTSEMGFSRYESIYTMPTTYTTPRDISNIPVGIEGFNANDILEVSYEGLLLSSSQYTVDYTNQTITLKQFTTVAGEQILFTVTRIQKASDVTSITSEIKTHMSTKATTTVEGHVTLSDSITQSASTTGIAATPKAVYDSQIMVDSGTSKKYKFGVLNGLVYIKEV